MWLMFFPLSLIIQNEHQTPIINYWYNTEIYQCA